MNQYEGEELFTKSVQVPNFHEVRGIVLSLQDNISKKERIFKKRR